MHGRQQRGGCSREVRGNPKTPDDQWPSSRECAWTNKNPIRNSLIWTVKIRMVLCEVELGNASGAAVPVRILRGSWR